MGCIMTPVQAEDPTEMVKKNPKRPVRQQKPADPPQPIEFPIVGIGASAGGLEAFEQLLSALPGHIGMAFVLIPHLAPEHESIMSELLAKHSKLAVMQATDGTTI